MASSDIGDKENLAVSPLPEGILREVLVRLPAKTLLRFKAVCKQWHYLISDPNLVKAHRRHAKKRYGFIVGVTDRCFYTLGDLGNLKCDTDTDTTTSLQPRCPDVSSVLGSCNGLHFGIDFSSGGAAFCWNPSTRKYLEVPCPPVLRDQSHNYLVSGLGYDSSTGDYKAVVAFYWQMMGDGGPDTYDHVLSFKTRTWKAIHNPPPQRCPYRVLTRGRAVVLDGTPHWVVKCNVGKSSAAQVILYFDAAIEQFKHLASPPPPAGSGGHSFIIDLGVLGGTDLCAFRNTPGSDRVQVWTMKEYGVDESWTLLFAIQSFWGQTWRPRWCDIACYFTRNNEVLLTPNKSSTMLSAVKGRRELLLYSPKSGRTRPVMVPGCSENYYTYGYTALSLEESLDWIDNCKGESFSGDWTMIHPRTAERIKLVG